MWTNPSDAQKFFNKRNIYYEKSKSITLKPFVKWVGGKSQLVEKLENMIPDKRDNVVTKYAEPFVGGGALLFYLLTKYKFKEAYISDNNPELINAYQVVKIRVDELIFALKKIQNFYLSIDYDQQKIYYYSSREKFNSLPLNSETSLQKAAYFIFLNKTCFNGLYRVNKKGQFNVPMGAYKSPNICDESNLYKVSASLKNVLINCCDFTKSSTFIDKNTLVYLDPPYRPLTETSKFTAYTTKCFNENEQLRLAKFVDRINEKGAKVIISNSDPKNSNQNDVFFEQLYGKYKISRVEATRTINCIAGKRGKINELLICNY